MNRLERVERQLIGQKEIVDFDHFRKKSSINKQQFKQVVYGKNWQWREKVFKIIKDNPNIYKHHHLHEMNRPELRKMSASMLFYNKAQTGIGYDDYMKDPNIVSVASSGFSTFDHGLSIKHGVHVFLYMKTIFNLGTEKHDRYVRAAAELKDIGCFGLTEFAHGSNVRGIQTEAHYDHRKREFVINSPTKEAMKFWIGAAAEVANMSVIWAQLYIDGKCYGVHAYIVPIRDTKTHQLLPGVLIGDCGPKNGCNGIDNGFILLDNVRVPAENQLDRISGVNEEGKFFTHVEGEEKRFGIQLGALSGGRFMVAMTSGVMTLSALTIAIRYSCIRRQFKSGSGLPENLLIEYPLTKRRMMPLLAQAIVYQMGNFAMIGEMDKNYKNILNPKNTVMQELHGISSSLKPKSGWLATETIRECRLMCGGHGYSYFSKLGVLYNDNDIQNTWEGDNHVLLQQATKYVLDNAQKVMKGKDITSPTLQFLKDPPNADEIVLDENSFMNLEFGVKFLQYKIYAKMQAMGAKMMELKQDKMANFDIWNQSQVFLGKVIALTLGDLYYLQNAMKKIQLMGNQANRKTLKSITQLWMLKVYRYDEFVDGVHHGIIEKLMMALSKEISYEALGLLESLSADDKVIGSPFACPEGLGFEKYMEMVENSNKMMTKPEWWKMLKQA